MFRLSRFLVFTLILVALGLGACQPAAASAPTPTTPVAAVNMDAPAGRRERPLGG
ncbi:MAG: hypothetical protein ACPLUL_13750 [Thermanaerothrix sp.]|uniref:hypothetical protein n=1 Tax=Thermanaerothrix sp. TaxID=2972675 RepID=UPI003C7C11CD